MDLCTRRDLLRSAAAGLAAAALLRGSAVAASRPPSFVVIVADDLGFGDVGFHGCPDIPTPHLDALAREGTEFRQGYVSAAVCSPSRAGLLTGRYQQRFGHENNPGPESTAEEDFGLPLTEVTTAERLKALGYATGLVGKWHLGYAPDKQPLQRGFDEFFGFLGGAHSYDEAGAGGPNPILRGVTEIDSVEYTTDDFAREAVDFVQRHASRPFYLYLAFNAVHSPMQAKAEDLERFAALADPKRRAYAGMLSALDAAVGRVLRALRDSGVDEGTLVFFLSDNGGPTKGTTSRNDPFRGAKTDLYEGGIRVPFLARWPGRIPAGRVVEEPVIALDVHPTLLALAGGERGAGPLLDGVDLLPHLTGADVHPPHDRLFWRMNESWAVREGDWKLVREGAGEPELYHLGEDPSESRDLAAREPGRVAALRAAYDAWDAQMVPPAWRQRRNRR